MARRTKFKKNEYHYLPDGRRTFDVKEFVEKWQEITHSLKPLGLHCYGFSDCDTPFEGSVSFHYEDFREPIQLSVGLILKIKNLLDSQRECEEIRKDADSNAS